MPPDIGWVDLGLGIFLLLSVLVGLVRGFVFELLSLAGWFVGGFVAVGLAPALEPHLPVGDPGTAVRHGATVVILFLLALLIWGLGARLVRAMIRSTPLSGIDRVLGAGFGFVRGVLVLLLLAVAVGLSPLARSAPWQQSRGAAWLEAAWLALRPMVLDVPADTATTT